jgi:hypothetical protein
MASIVVNAAVSSASSALASTAASSFIQSAGITSAIGSSLTQTAFSALGSAAGRQVTRAVSGLGKEPRIRGGKLKELDVQSSAYGRVITQVYGSSRVAGNIIWAQPIKQTEVSNGGGGKGGAASVSSSSASHYQYGITLAIGICEGEIDSIKRVWADAKVIDPSQFSSSYQLYVGNETQMPDSTMEGFDGAGNVPAYRGLAYVVIEDFSLADYGNRIPNFTFEVQRKFKPVDVDGKSVEDLVTSMIVIPGSGEFVYDTVTQNKVPGQEVAGQWVSTDVETRINQTNNEDKANALVALDDLQDTCPNVNWVGLVATWFGDSLDAGACTIRAGVEYQAGAQTQPDEWSVAGHARASAYLISQDAEGNPVYGGTPSDAGIVRYLDEMKSRGMNVMFYPMFFMDTASKPWRGRVTGSETDVASFFTKPQGYNEFILHYANLVKDKVDAFVIGSELIGLTKVTDGAGNYPAVDELIALAASVKAIVGASVKVTYAADWSEYHHADGGWYNLDPLWASSDIDFIGIDAYFPLTDTPQNVYNIDNVKAGWTSGEGYDFYYVDGTRTATAPLAQEFAWKNIEWWWKNIHTNPNSSATPWMPMSKPIWFTEYGFPSVDGATNQPNVFYDPDSSESYFPRFSRERIDNRAQRLGIAATESMWANSTMIENKFVWTWDARPYPFWPELTDVWSDGGLWKTGHWVQGKLGISGLGAIVEDLCLRSGLSNEQVDVSRLHDLVDGYVLSDLYTAKQAIEVLQQAYFFDAVESDGVMRFIPRGGEQALSIDDGEIVSGELLDIYRAKEHQLPHKVDVSYVSRANNYQAGNQHARRMKVDSEEQMLVSLPIVMEKGKARAVAETILYNAWMERVGYQFSLPPSYSYLEPTDIVNVQKNGINHVMRVVQTSSKDDGVLMVSTVAEDISIYDSYAEPNDVNKIELIKQAGDSSALLLDLPVLPNEQADGVRMHVAVRGDSVGWHGAVLYRSDDDGLSYQEIDQTTIASTSGAALTVLANSEPQRFDVLSTVDVAVNAELESVSFTALLNGANVAMLGSEIIQFQTAQLMSHNIYRLSGLLRGRLGTEITVADHALAEPFVLVNSALLREDISDALLGLERCYKVVSGGNRLEASDEIKFIQNGRRLKPFAPVHVQGKRTGGGDLIISWVRRARANGHWRDKVDVPLVEVTELYEIELFDGEDVVRTLTNTMPVITYSAADQIADFGIVQIGVSIKIYQLSDMVGRGEPASAVI